MSEETKNQLVKAGAAVATILAVVLGVVCFVGAVAYASYSVFHLFAEVVRVTPFEAGAAALSSVGLAVASLFVIVSSRHNYNLRAMAAIVLLFSVLITLPLVAVDASLRSAILTNVDALINIGRVIAAILPALALAAVVALVLSMNDTTPHKSAAAAIAKYVGFAAKFVAIGASIFASAYFGMSRGIDPILAVLCGALLESAFLWSYFALKKSREAQDGFDVALWSVAVLTFGAFIAAVSVETVSSLARIEVPIVAALGEVGASLYVSAVGLSLVLTVVTHLLTQAIDVPTDGSAHTIKQPAASRIANAIRGAKAGAGEVRAALKGNTAPALPAPATLGSEGVTPATMRFVAARIFIYNGEPAYDEGGEITAKGTLIGEVGMKAFYNAGDRCTNLRIWLFDKALMQSVQTPVVAVLDKPFTLAAKTMTAEMVTEDFRRDADGTITYARVAVSIVTTLTDDDIMPVMADSQRSETGVPYDTTGEVAREDWPTDEERRRVLAELQRKRDGVDAKK